MKQYFLYTRFPYNLQESDKYEKSMDNKNNLFFKI